MAGIALDTSAYSHFRANHPDVVTEIAEAAIVHVPMVVVGELHAGFQVGRRTKENLAVLEEFLAEPFVETIGVNVDVARTYGTLFARLRRAGTPVAANDIWIAASAIVAGTKLVTFDRDFERFRGLDRRILE